VAFSGATSADPDDGDVLNMAWTVNGTNVGTGETLDYDFAQDGNYAIRLIVSDNHGAADTTSTTANVSNVAPAVSMLPTATLLPGETYSADGSFSDPGADPWTATVNYGEGAGEETLVLDGKAFVLSHSYLVAGTFTVTVRREYPNRPSNPPSYSASRLILASARSVRRWSVSPSSSRVFWRSTACDS
jgi:hypothetical protein